MLARSPERKTRKFKLKLPWLKQKASKDNDLEGGKISAKPEAPSETRPSSSASRNGRWIAGPQLDDESDRWHGVKSVRRLGRRRAQSFSEGNIVVETREPGVETRPEFRVGTSDHELRADDSAALVEKSVWAETCGRSFDLENFQPLVRTLSSSALSWSEGLAEAGDAVLESIADSTDVVTKFLFLEDYIAAQDFPRRSADSLDRDSRSSLSRSDSDSNSLVDKTSESDADSLVDKTSEMSSDESSVEEMRSFIRGEFSSKRDHMIKDMEVFDPKTSKTVKKKVFMC